jgi:tetratricopeptide (TPR) repeat protein
MPSENPEGEKVDVANLLQEAGQAFDRSELTRAADLYLHCLNYLDRHEQGDSPESALCLQKLAEIYHQVGQPHLAIPAYQRLLTLGEQILGQHHAEVIAAAYRLACTFDQANIPREAEAMYKRAASSAERTFGLAHGTSQKIRESYFAFLQNQEAKSEPAIPDSFGQVPETYETTSNGEASYLSFMPPPPPKSKSRLRELERDVIPVKTGQTREYQSVSGIDFALLAKNTGPSRAIKSLGILHRSPSKIKHLRYGAESADEEVEKSLVLKTLIKRWDLIAYLSVAVGAIIVFTVILFGKIGSISSTVYEDAVTQLLRTNKSFQSIDGITALEFADSGPFVTLVNDVRHRRIPYVILKGGLSDIGVMIQSAFIHRETWYQSKESSLTSDNGVVLYAKDSHDLELAPAMKTFKDYLEAYYRLHHTYPSSQKRYTQERKDETKQTVDIDVQYANPYTGKPDYPTLATLDINTDKDYLFPGITDTKSNTAVLKYLREGGKWRDNLIARPGRICALGLRHGVEKCGEDYFTSEIYIMAFDSSAHLMSGGLPGITYVIGLIDGKSLSDEDADHKIDVEQSSVHPPERICIVRGDTENVGMMRNALTITLVFALIGSFAGFLYLEFKNRKADPRRAPQVFEICGGVTLFILIIIWIIHVFPF